MPQHSEHNSIFDDRQQINRAREEAEVLFLPKPKFVEPSTLADPPSSIVLARQPRVLSASAPSLDRESAEGPINSAPRMGRAILPITVLTDRERLKRARKEIFRQQDALQAKLVSIGTELRAIDAYESVKAGQTTKGLTGCGKKAPKQRAEQDLSNKDNVRDGV